MVRAAKDELELLSRNADCLEDCRYAELVVLCTVVDELNGSLEVVKEAVTKSSQR